MKDLAALVHLATMVVSVAVEALEVDPETIQASRLPNHNLSVDMLP